MNTLRRHLPRATWLALVAVLAMALLPTLSHALMHARGNTSIWAEVCTPQGMRMVAVDAVDVGDPAPAAGTGHLEHCPFCAQAAQDFGPPSAAVAAAQMQLPADAVPRLFLQARRTLFAWAPALPRGPPSFS